MTTAQMEPAIPYDLYSHAVQEDPYQIYAELLERAPVFHNAERGFWALSRFDDVQGALRDWRRFSSAAGVRLDDLLELAGPSMITMDPPRHRVLRDIVRPAFQLRAIAALEQMVERKVRTLLDALGDADEIEIANAFAKRLPVLVICELMGLPEQDATMLKGWADDIVECSREDGGTPEAARAAAVNLRAYFGEQLAARRRRPSEDLISRLVAAPAQGEALSPEEQIGMCNLLFEAGNTTTGSLIANGLVSLAAHPQELAWLREHLDALPRAIEELLRYDAPVQNLMRTTTKPIKLHGVEIPAGAMVVLVLGAANRDPRAWEDPNVLRLDREPRRNVAFGEGIHHCMGAPLSRLEGRIAFRLLLSRMPDYEIVELERFHDLNLRMLKRLVVRPGRAA